MKPLLTEMQGRVLRALTRSIATDGKQDAKAARYSPSLVVESFETVDWASLTFAGQRHRIVARVGGDGLADRLTALTALDLVVAGQMVAEVRTVGQAVDDTRCLLTIEVLTIDSPS